MDNGFGRVIFTHVWVSTYETHRFLQVDSGQWDPRVLGRHKNHIYIYILIEKHVAEKSHVIYPESLTDSLHICICQM